MLRARLPLLRGWTDRRRLLARRYREALRDIDTVVVPPELDSGHVYHLFPVRSAAREAMQTHLRAAGIETLVHYPIPIPHQPALATERPDECPIATRVCSEIFSLPLYPSLGDDAVLQVAAALMSGPRTANGEPGAANSERRASNDAPRTR